MIIKYPNQAGKVIKLADIPIGTIFQATFHSSTRILYRKGNGLIDLASHSEWEYPDHTIEVLEIYDYIPFKATLTLEYEHYSNT